MIVVIQCAASKQANAGCMSMPDGQDVTFVADPARAPEDGKRRFVRPDDVSPFGDTWRQRLMKFGEKAGANHPLLPAYRLYRHPAYQGLVQRFGIGSVYILSAGWGLLRADFPTPYYDITFSQNAEPYKRRRPGDSFEDFRMPLDVAMGPIVFVGGKDYAPLFRKLTTESPVERIVFYNAAIPPEAPGCTLHRFPTTTRTNWHYECANHLIRYGLSARPYESSSRTTSSPPR